jgi:hypothetical protein
MKLEETLSARRLVGTCLRADLDERQRVSEADPGIEEEEEEEEEKLLLIIST